jgi:hypothetical protein
VAVKRRHPYDFLFLHGHRDHVARDAVLMGTAFSAPFVMLGAQAVATARLLRSNSETAERVLGTLGAAMVPGYLGEALVRKRLRRSGYEPLESPLVMIGIILAAAMGILGLISRRQVFHPNSDNPEDPRIATGIVMSAPEPRSGDGH